MELGITGYLKTRDMQYHVVTYATHNHGLFGKLVDNAYSVPITVLGWGQAWRGFTDKLRAMEEFCATVAPSDVVIFVDGFDSLINRHPKEAIDRFEAINPPTGILVSVEPPWILGSVFGSNYQRCRINSGMYMGYVQTVRHFLRHVLLTGAQDDQLGFNNSCDLVDTDISSVIFRNLPLRTNGPTVCSRNTNHLNTVFVSFPGSQGCVAPPQLMVRSLHRMTLYFWPWALALLVYLVTSVVLFKMGQVSRR